MKKYVKLILNNKKLISYLIILFISKNFFDDDVIFLVLNGIRDGY